VRISKENETGNESEDIDSENYDSGSEDNDSGSDDEARQTMNKRKEKQ